MNNFFNLLTVSTIVCLTACSSSGSDGGGTVPSLAADVQGAWVTPCAPDADGDLTHLETTFNGSSFRVSNIVYINTDTCSGENYIRRNAVGSFVITGGVIELADGNAKHLDIQFSNGTLTAGSITHNELAAEGITLQDVATSQGITDINSIPISEFGFSDSLYTIYRVEGDVLLFGSALGSQNGATAELRYTILDSGNAYTRK